MTTPEITRIRAALEADLKDWGNINTAWVTQPDDDGNEGLNIVGAVIDGEMYPVLEIDTAQYYQEDAGPKLAEYYAACNTAAMAEVLAHIDAQAAIRDNHAKTIEKQQAEIERLRVDAARYQWLKQNGGYFALPTRPLTNDLDEAIDAAMRETP